VYHLLVNNCTLADSDNRFYQCLDSDPIQADQKIIRDTIKCMIATCEIPPTVKHIVVTTTYTLRFYMLPKIHKTDNPGHPIVSACCCPTENIPSYLEVMAPFVRKLPTYFKDTNHALGIFASFRFNKSDPCPHFLFTIDIKSLYTVIPNHDGLQSPQLFPRPKDCKGANNAHLDLPSGAGTKSHCIFI